jgi:hypothetical protein
LAVSAQFEASDDPLDKITTAEAIRTLIDFYRASHFCYAARENVDAISKVVSFSSDILILIALMGMYLLKSLW